MTAHQAGMRNGLTAIGFSVAAAAEIVNEQGYDPLTTLAELTDITIGDLISTVRKPGGSIPNPGFPPGPPIIPNPGINIGHHAVTNLKLTDSVA